MNLHTLNEHLEPRIGSRVRLPEHIWQHRADTGTIVALPHGYQRFYLVRPDHPTNSFDGFLRPERDHMEVIG